MISISFWKIIFKFIFVLLSISSSLFSQQKVALISGASKGIGLATAKAFQQKGWKVWAGIRLEIPEELKDLPNVNFCYLDVTSDDLVQKAVKTILEKDGRIDVLINNAGYGLIGPEECVTIAEAKQLFEVNFFGVLRLTQAVLPTMKAQHSGHILNISSGAGVYSLPGLGLYSSSKFALEDLSDSLSATLSRWNIKVSVTEPGFVKNDWGTHCHVGTRECQDAFYDDLTKGIRKMLAVPRGQPCGEIATLLVEIAENEAPNVRYQTSSGMQEWVAEKYVDPTGMKAHRESLQFIKQQIKNAHGNLD